MVNNFWVVERCTLDGGSQSFCKTVVTTRLHNPEDNRYIHRRENFTSQDMLVALIFGSYSLSIQNVLSSIPIAGSNTENTNKE
jgi:hypothetical protein